MSVTAKLIFEKHSSDHFPLERPRDFLLLVKYCCNRKKMSFRSNGTGLNFCHTTYQLYVIDQTITLCGLQFSHLKTEHNETVLIMMSY